MNGNLINDDTSHCPTCSKRLCSLIRDLKFDELSQIDDKRLKRSFKRGDYIFKVGQKSSHLLSLSSGKIKITKQGDLGNEMIVELKKTGDFIGLESLSSEKKYSTDAIALDDVEVCFIDKNKYLSVLENNSQFSSKIIKHFADRISSLEYRLLNLSKKHLRGRMAEALLLVEDTFGSDPVEGMLRSPLKRAEYAALANITTANAIRILSDFNKEGLILMVDKKIKLIERNTLELVSIS